MGALDRGVVVGMGPGYEARGVVVGVGPGYEARGVVVGVGSGYEARAVVVATLHTEMSHTDLDGGVDRGSRVPQLGERNVLNLHLHRHIHILPTVPTLVPSLFPLPLLLFLLLTRARGSLRVLRGIL